MMLMIVGGEGGFRYAEAPGGRTAGGTSTGLGGARGGGAFARCGLVPPPLHSIMVAEFFSPNWRRTS
eukprot:SAG25_NODE_43_length_19261_cov_111.931218_11_plen_67_part_00